MSNKIYCTRCASLCHTDAWCPYRPTDHMVPAIDFSVGISEQRSLFIATDHEIKDGDVVEFRGFGTLDRKQYRVARGPDADSRDSVNLSLTEVRPA